MFLILALALLLWPVTASAFDMCFDYRATAPFVTDPSCGVPVLAEAYPNTYTNANGDSVNAGFTVTTSVGLVNSDATNDPRIAGINYYLGDGVGRRFQVDLSSGSNPGAGTYRVDMAHGDPNSSQTISFKFYDNSTLLIDGSNGGSGFNTGAADNYIDATLSSVTSTTTWTGATVNKTFSSTTANLDIGVISGGFSTLAHFRMTKLTTVSGPPPQRTMTGVGL